MAEPLPPMEDEYFTGKVSALGSTQASGYARFIGYLGGRKCFIVLLAMLISSFLVFNKSIGEIVYQYIMIGIVAAYITGNVVQKRTPATGTEKAASSS